MNLRRRTTLPSAMGMLAGAIALLASTTALRAADPLSAMNTWVGGGLAANKGSWTAYAFLFLGGILASLLPCVYPLYPITASVVSSRATGSATRWLHPVGYYAGLAGMYSLLGFVAGVSGGAFNSVMHIPLVNVLIAVLFLLLGLATAGFLHIRLFGMGQAGNTKPGIVGTVLMGMVAGVLSSSCVGPFVVSILIGIASATGGFALGAAMVAALKMLAFGLGLGAPFLLVGLFGARIPKAGAWMRYVQWLLGALIGYFSYIYLEKGLSGFGFEPGTIQLIFGSALLFLFAACKLQPESAGFERVPRALYALLAVVAALSLARGILPSSSGAASAATVTANSGPAIERIGNLNWYLKREDALAESQRTGKPVFVDFFGTWCANCAEFEKLTHSDGKLNEALVGAVLLRIQDTAPEFKEWQSDKRFPELKVGLPFFVIMDGQGHLLFKTSDYTRTDDMILFLQG